MCYRYTTGQSLSVPWQDDEDPSPRVHKLIAPSDERVAAAVSQPRPERSAAKRNAHYPTARFQRSRIHPKGCNSLGFRTLPESTRQPKALRLTRQAPPNAASGSIENTLFPTHHPITYVAWVIWAVVLLRPRGFVR